MLILGIETSCDETAVAVVRDGTEVLANEIASSADLHVATGGIVPEVAAREHVTVMSTVIERAVATAGIALSEVNAIAVTVGPGLPASLASGVVTANTLAELLDVPLIAVNHIAGHIRSNWLGRAAEAIQYPVVTLTASGGHNDLVLLRDARGEPELIGESLDDAAGEAFDKVARLLGLPYPGGPAIEQQAAQSQISNFKIQNLPRAWLIPKDVARNFDAVEVGVRLRDGRLKLANYNFSFSGLKSEVRRQVEMQNAKLNMQNGRASYSQDAGAVPTAVGTPGCREREDGDTQHQDTDFVVQLAYAFQEAVVDVLATKLVLAARQYSAAEIHLAGGVSANRRLRAMVQEHAGGQTVVRWPEKMSYCTDNAAMIAAEGFRLLTQDPDRRQSRALLTVQSSLSL